ncbi:MAG TPA: hypothetical protein ENF56_00445 [Candidatus Bathyarchaeota archaeon]|nr:hypothetical protein [Candidatus Bathyarchaeota archaeon]
MNSRERVIRAITFEEPDRVPVMHSSLRWSGSEERRNEFRKIIEKYPEDYGYSHYHGSGKVDKRTVRGVYRDEWGVVWKNVTGSIIGQIVHHPLSNWEAFSSYEFPDPLEDPVFEFVERYIQKVGHEKYISVDYISLFERMQALRGFERLMVDIMKRRKEFYTLADQIVKYNLERIKRWLEMDVDEIYLGDDWGTQDDSMVSPKVWREMFKPYYKRMVDAVHKGGRFVHFHSDGNIFKLLPEMIDCGFDVIHAQVKIMGIQRLAENFGGKVCFRADSDRQRILPFGSVDDVRRHVKEIIEKLGCFGGGLIGYAMIAPDVPVRNYEAVYKTYFEYGRYR